MRSPCLCCLKVIDPVTKEYAVSDTALTLLPFREVGPGFGQLQPQNLAPAVQHGRVGATACLRSMARRLHATSPSSLPTRLASIRLPQVFNGVTISAGGFTPETAAEAVGSGMESPFVAQHCRLGGKLPAGRAFACHRLHQGKIHCELCLRLPAQRLCVPLLATSRISGQQRRLHLPAHDCRRLRCHRLWPLLHQHPRPRGAAAHRRRMEQVSGAGRGAQPARLGWERPRLGREDGPECAALGHGRGAAHHLACTGCDGIGG